MNSIIISILFLIVFISFWIIYSGRLSKLYKKIRNHRNLGKSDVEKSKAKLYSFNDVDKEIDSLLEERLAEIDRLEKLETYRKEYLGNVSHELKTPIFNIQGYIMTLLDGGLEDKTVNRDFLIRASQSVERMIGIVDDLEAISQLEAGELQLDQESFDIVALTKDVFKFQEMKATAKGVMLSLKDSDEKPTYVMGDKFRIRQVIANLVVNSIKYSKEYGETKAKFYDMGETVLVELSDNGIGIAAKHLPRLFERFYRVDKHRSREQGGTGLGLAIVKHILEAHGQTINVMSTEGVGSVFSFTLKKGV